MDWRVETNGIRGQYFPATIRVTNEEVRERCSQEQYTNFIDTRQLLKEDSELHLTLDSLRDSSFNYKVNEG